MDVMQAETLSGCMSGQCMVQGQAAYLGTSMLQWQRRGELQLLATTSSSSSLGGLKAALSAAANLTPAVHVLQWALIILQAFLEISGFTIQRYANTCPGAAELPPWKRPWWKTGVALYNLSILVYFFVLSISALSWLAVVSCTVNILFSVLSAHVLGEKLGVRDACVIVCAIMSATLAALFGPEPVPTEVFRVGAKVLSADIEALHEIGCFALLLIAALITVKIGPRMLAAAAAVSSYAMASALAQLCSKLLAAFMPECGWLPKAMPGVAAPACVGGHLGIAVLLFVAMCCGGVSLFFMVKGVEWYENKFWLPTALALDVFCTSAVGLVVFNESKGMDSNNEFMAFGLSAVLAGATLALGSAGQAHDKELPCAVQ